MNKYCIKCGHKHEFTFEPPVFCESCGNQFSQSSVVASKPAPTRPVYREQQQEEQDDTPLPNISKLDVVIENIGASRVTVESVKNAPMAGGVRPPSEKLTKQDVERQFAEQFRRERSEFKEEIS